MTILSESSGQPKKNIGIFFPSSKKGGVYQYALSIADALINYCHEFEYSILYHEEKPKLFFNKKNSFYNYLKVPLINFSFTRRAIQFLGLATKKDFLLAKDLSKIIKKAKIDLLIVPTPFSYDIPVSIPFIVSIPDYMHRYFPNFPEYSFKDRLSRDIVYGYYGKKSLLVVADSVQQINDLYKFSGVRKEKVEVIPYIPPTYVFHYKNMDEKTIEKLLKKYQLPENFIFYPAQFWFQKNHARLIKALHLIKKKYKVEIPLILTGNSKGNIIYEKAFQEIIDLIGSLGMNNQVIYLGYVSPEEAVALYKKTIALVSPALQGPTTIPPLEAMALGVPAVTVNLFEISKQVGNAGLLFDPFNIEDIAEKIYKIWIDKNLREELIKKGYQKIKELTLENYAKKWEKAIEKALNTINYE